MCIAIYKDAKASPVKRKIFKRCWEMNDNGAGYAFWDKDKKKWIARKGFLTWGAFWKSFNSHQFQKNDTYLAHFRIGTSGNRKGADCTHPFPVSGDCEFMRKTEFETKNLVLHNGIHGGGEGTISDTMLAVRDWIWTLWPLMNHKLRGARVMEMMTDGLKINTNRWLITEGYEVILIGDWHQDEDTGVRYSNKGYIEPTPIVYAGSRHNHNPSAASPPITGSTTVLTKNTGTDTEFSDEDGIDRVFSPSYITKYTDKEGHWNWIAWTEDWRQHEEAKKILSEQISSIPPSEEEENPVDTSGVVSPSLTCAYKDEPVSVMGMVDANGDVDWEGDYAPNEDLLLCPHCKCHEYLVDPQDIKATQKYPGDSMCGKCGCLFMDDDGQIVGFDMKLREEYKDASKSE